MRIKPKDLAAAGVERVGRVEDVCDGLPCLADGRTLEPANAIWCTGFRPGQADWIDLAIFGELEPEHHRGVVESQPGLYYVGLLFLYAVSSEVFHGVGRDAAYVADALAARVNGGQK